jgi:hypothetical protein
MKRLIQSIAIICFSGLVLVSCQSDKVSPQDKNSGNPSLSGAAGDEHPALDVVCQTTDTMFLVREDNGSLKVDKCFGFGGIPVACPPGQMNWGYMIGQEGYINDQNVVDFDFTMAPGWYMDLCRWKFGLENTIPFTLAGIPAIGTDWGNQIVNPTQNKVHLRIPVGNFPTPSFDIALNVTAVRLNLFGAVTPGSQTALWSRNRNWQSNTGNAQSDSQWLLHFTPVRCMDMPPAEPVCRTLAVGNPNLSGCTTLSPVNTGSLTGNLTYEWSNGATTATINVCPTATTTYSVTVSEDGRPAIVNDITVNVMNVACTHGNGNGNGNNQHKVNVCHVPPGNPNNTHEICIDWSGVPAHVEAYRPAGSNQGHNSGCQIGRCGSNPCL